MTTPPKSSGKAEIPYPAVFHDWAHPEQRVAAAGGLAGVFVEMLLDSPPGAWKRVELTEEDACLLAAALLRAAGKKKLVRRVLRSVTKRKETVHRDK